MFKKILVPIDGSENAFLALKHACKMANLTGAEIDILSVYRHHGYIESALSMVRSKEQIDGTSVDEGLKKYASDIVSQGKEIAKESGVESVRGFVKMGQAAKMIVEFSKEHQNDLIVIGSQGHGDLSGYLLGGVSHKVTGLAKCPVLVV